ncbi:DUF3108 domain-containing protein [Ideonella sp.]|jgi:hypothetical protein|uniref:DUF3108 domain-containing protein n=1 Tax=Ideonella sp. TaxID=1929293 RepID=UPI0037C091EB
MDPSAHHPEPQARATAPGFARHRRLLAALVVVVVLAHAGIGWQVAESRIGEGDADTAPKALEISFVKELMPEAPPVLVAPPPAAPPAPVVAEVAPAASAASAPEPVPEPPKPTQPPPPVEVAQVREEGPVPPPTEWTPPPSSVELSMASPAPPGVTPQTFSWPASTRLVYKLVGDFRGPIEGNATVEWLRRDDRYQVRIEVGAALIFTRRMISDGVLSTVGLTPQRYDEETDAPFSATRRQTVRFSADRIELANGTPTATVPGVQDPASQLVQITWRMLTQPELAQPGQVVELPLALPRRMGQWTYDVTGFQTVELPFGATETLRLVPRTANGRGDEITMEVWLAPSLQYLPVRIRFSQAKTGASAELTLTSRPLQANDAPTPVAAPSQR